ncbi:Nucleotidyltransferase domain protein [compost metagenome]
MSLDNAGLPEDAIQSIRQVLSQFPAVEQAILYGSRAKGTYRPGSDIDLTLKGGLLTYQNLLDIELALDDLLLPWKIDLSLHPQIDNPALLEHIARVGKTLYARC